MSAIEIGTHIKYPPGTILGALPDDITSVYCPHPSSPNHHLGFATGAQESQATATEYRRTEKGWEGRTTNKQAWTTHRGVGGRRDDSSPWMPASSATVIPCPPGRLIT